MKRALYLLCAVAVGFGVGYVVRYATVPTPAPEVRFIEATAPPVPTQPAPVPVADATPVVQPPALPTQPKPAIAPELMQYNTAGAQRPSPDAPPKPVEATPPQPQLTQAQINALNRAARMERYRIQAAQRQALAEQQAQALAAQQRQLQAQQQAAAEAEAARRDARRRDTEELMKYNLYRDQKTGIVMRRDNPEKYRNMPLQLLPR
jgi:hypothetical protein